MVKDLLDKAVSAKDQSGEDLWRDGREVAIRPDVAGPEFHPDVLSLIKSDEERLEAQSRIERVVSETKGKSPEANRTPDWLPADDETSTEAGYEADDGEQNTEPGVSN